MPLPYEVESLDAVPEAARGLYEETDGGFRLPVEGVKPDSEIAGMESALAKLKRERNEFRDRAARATDEDIEELKAFREQARKKEEKSQADEGKLDELRAKWQEETASQLAEKDKALAEKEATIRSLAIMSQLQAAIANAGVLDDFRTDARRALLADFETDVKQVDGKPTGVFVDEVHGDKTIAEFVAEWAMSKAAQKYMPAPKGGGGGTGRESNGVSVTSNKAYGEMTTEEKAEFLNRKYGSAA
jgi:flagellar biosynthesis GTPase FlhF